MALTDVIRQPGKFEGEPEYVRDVLWPMVLDGASDETWTDDDDSPIDVFRLDANTRREYGLEPDDYAVFVWEREDGFVCSRVVDRRTFDRIKRATCGEN